MNRPGGFNSPHTGGFYVLLADGSARFNSGNISPDTFRALLTRDGGETVGEY
jgi:prepilin-type processing-associated H-X9-DG protein